MRLFFLLFSIVVTALAGVGVTGVLAAGMQGWIPIVAAAGIGAALALPITWIAARKLANL
jgi:hypothetical protein